MEKARAELRAKNLSACDRDDDAATSKLSLPQVKRLSGHRLDQTLSQVSSHAAWSSGLALSDHVCALRSSMVLDSTKEARDLIRPEFEKAFNFDSEILQNPEPIPMFKRSCATVHGGICAGDPHFKTIVKMAARFHSEVTGHKLAGSPFLVRLRVSDAEPAASAPAETWLLVAAVCHRPLCHSLMHMLKSQHQLRFALQNGELRLGTFHRVLRSLLHGVSTNENLEDFALQACVENWQVFC